MIGSSARPFTSAVTHRPRPRDAAHHVYLIRADLTMMGARGDSTARGGRHLRAKPDPRRQLPSITRPCVGAPHAAAISTPTHLNGDPTDGNFESGDQASTSSSKSPAVLKLARRRLRLRHQRSAGSSVSDRDGMLTFSGTPSATCAWPPRLPDAYEHSSTATAAAGASSSTIWGRAWLYLEAPSPSRPRHRRRDDHALVMNPSALGDRTATHCRGCP